MFGVVIRSEAPQDIDAIREITIAAFRDHAYSHQTEHLIVGALRADGALAISLVAVRDGHPVGHVAFSEAVVGDSERGWFLLGPVAVLPTLQGRGIGSALVFAGLDELRVRGASGCVLVGDLPRNASPQPPLGRVRRPLSRSLSRSGARVHGGRRGRRPRRPRRVPKGSARQVAALRPVRTFGNDVARAKPRALRLCS